MNESYVRLNEQGIMVVALSQIHVKPLIGAYQVAYIIWFGAFINNLN